jgi:hypothetical protein
VSVRDIFGHQVESPGQLTTCSGEFGTSDLSEALALPAGDLEDACEVPYEKGRAATMTHDYKHHGTADLFAARNVATGTVLYATKDRHSARSRKFSRSFVSSN